VAPFIIRFERFPVFQASAAGGGQDYGERLIVEGYESQGYFFLRNVMGGKREKGGWECELNIVAFPLDYQIPPTPCGKGLPKNPGCCPKIPLTRNSPFCIFTSLQSEFWAI
jgi:hypothetical protein